MSNELRKKSLYFDNGDPATYHVATEYKPGELGEIVTVAEKSFQKVVLDSGATASTAVGIVAAGQVAYWKDKSTYIVTNDSAQALGANSVLNGGNSSFRNEVAGVFGVAVAAAEYCAVQFKGRCNVKAASGGTYGVGNTFVANTGTAADGTTIDVGTAITSIVVGVVAGARSAPNAPIDLNLPNPE